MAITERSKMRISEAFETLEESLKNVRKQISLAGIDGFKQGEVNNIYEMAGLYNKIMDVQSKVDVIRPTINEYVLDLVVEKVVANKDNKSKDSIDNKLLDSEGNTIELADEVMLENDISIRRVKGELPVYVTLTDGKNINASARILSDKKVIISVGSIISGVEDKTLSKTNSSRREKMLLKKELVHTDGGELKFTTDVKVDSLRIATNIIFGRTLNGVDKLWKTIDGITLREYLSK